MSAFATVAGAEDAEAALARIRGLARRRETHGGIVWHLWGEGEPLVLLHGNAGSWRHWVRNVERLSAQHLVIAPDLPGFGESGDPPATLGGMVAMLSEDISTLLPGETRYALVGFSLGATIAGHVAARDGRRIRRLVLVGSGGLTAPRGIELERVRDKQGAARVAAHRANLQRIMIADPDAIDALALAVQEWNSRHARLNVRGLVPPLALAAVLPRVVAPVDAIWGERDQPAAGFLPERIAALRALRPEARVATVPHAGHWVAFEAADAFEAALLSMLDHR